MSKFHVGQKVELMWDKTPYYAEGFLKIGVVKSVPSRTSRCYHITGVNPTYPGKVYQFFEHEMVGLVGPTLDGDVL